MWQRWLNQLARVPGRVWQGAFWSCTAAVLYMTLRPAAPELEFVQFQDKLEHVVAFAALAALGLLAGWRRRWKLGLALVGLGVGIELLQLLTATRHADVADAVADALGVLLVLVTWPGSGQPEEDGR